MEQVGEDHPGHASALGLEALDPPVATLHNPQGDDPLGTYTAADLQEALSIKYSADMGILRLSSGHYALLGHFNNGTGMPLLAIGDWESLEQFLKNYAPTFSRLLQLAEEHLATQTFRQPPPPRMPRRSADDLLSDL